ncbi:hypothetical protein GMOD_00004520 [Pyrenophora seminiperda CCB06]|uniref:Uncharacterized protein n=1 Tax=Pyrenophora seminiperda CCB06 TaxID=1302712 RepID=A0A3M7M1I8_9PLEO|nr:hypothetical protein GMOD_00004520 [Pyrenophora seminiperda CCB06]
MHASSIIALALGATAVSAAAFPNVEARQDKCDPYCQFPASVDCPVRGGVHVTKQQLASSAQKGDRSGSPYEQSASNLATTHCSGTQFKGIPLWTTDIHASDNQGAGSMFYAAAPNGTFYFCGTTSGRTQSGWPDSCKENTTP